MPVTPKTDPTAKKLLRGKINRGLEGALAEAEQSGYLSADESKQQRSDLLRKARAKQQRKPSTSR
jgi:hypothetical protein